VNFALDISSLSNFNGMMSKEIKLSMQAAIKAPIKMADFPRNK
jgi:hypothetical protein